MHSWTHGSPYQDQPPAPPASQDAVMVPLSTPEQYLISSSSSIPSSAAAASAAAAAAAADQGGADQGGGSWVDMSNAIWNPQIAGVPAPRCWEFGTNPNPTGGPIVPARLPAMQPQFS